MQTFYYAHITHDNLKNGPDVPKGKQKVLIYVAEAINAHEAHKQITGLESEFQGQNFKVLNWGKLQSTPNRPIFMGVELQPVVEQLVTDWRDLPQGKEELRSADCTDCD